MSRGLKRVGCLRAVEYKVLAALAAGTSDPDVTGVDRVSLLRYDVRASPHLNSESRAPNLLLEIDSATTAALLGAKIPSTSNEDVDDRLESASHSTNVSSCAIGLSYASLTMTDKRYVYLCEMPP